MTNTQGLHKQGLFIYKKTKLQNMSTSLNYNVCNAYASSVTTYTRFAGYFLHLVNNFAYKNIGN